MNAQPEQPNPPNGKPLIEILKEGVAARNKKLPPHLQIPMPMTSEEFEAKTERESRMVNATPFVWRDPAKIPPRQWIYGRDYIREFITATVATGGVGKSSLVIVETLSIVTMRPLLGVTPAERANVWYWCGEDPADELERRFAAAMLHYGIDPSEVEGRLFVDTGRKQKIVIAEQTQTGAKIARPIVDAVIATILENKIGVLIIDPFVASHRITENDNGAIELVAAAWAEIADVTGCAIVLVLHTRKTGGAEVTTEDNRGASALLAKARSGRALNQMSADEAAKAGVEDRRSYFRVSTDKANMSKPADRADWYRLASVDLPNGDDVGVATRWQWPDAFEGVTVGDLRKAQAAIRIGGPWRESPQAAAWAGNAIAKAMGLDPTNKADRAKVSALLKTWIAKGMFNVVDGEDDKRMPRKFIEVGEAAND
jgi:AAA domain-containing protein